MAFLIPDNLRSRKDVSAELQRVATALKLGLDDIATVWFEPLFDATGQKPHFIVLLPDNGIAVLEVFDVKTGRVLGSLRGELRIERDGREVEVEQPLARAEAFATVLRERIQTEPRLRDARIPVAAAALFPTLSCEEAEGRGLDAVGGLDLHRCVFQEELDEARTGATNALERRFATALGLATPIEGELEATLRALIQPELVISGPGDDDQLAIFAPPEGDALVRALDREQEAVAKKMGEGHRVVRGVAGSGKTLILVFRAKLFAELYPREKFLLTCYTRALASELRAYLKDFENVEVRTIQSLIHRAIRDAGLDAPAFDADRSGEQRATLGVQALEHGALPRYRAVFVDEAQDLGPSALRFAVLLADERFNDVLVVADAAQNVFRQQFNWKQAGIQAQGRTRILRRNYRNTREIVEFAYAFLTWSSRGDSEALDLEDESVVIPPEAAVRSGPAPTLLFCEPDEVVRRAVAEAQRLLGARKTPKKLAILAMGNREAIDLERQLVAEKLEFFFVSDPRHKDNADRMAEAEEPIVLSTVYSAKGMEFPNVVLCCTPREGMEPEELRSAIYVGMTRATENLVVLAAKDHVLADELVAAAEDRARIGEC
ncbi:MAG: 3'-5' exonuclease [Gaiellaceae bacterium]